MCGLVEAGPTAGGGGRTLQLFCLWQATATTKHVVALLFQQTRVFCLKLVMIFLWQKHYFAVPPKVRPGSYFVGQFVCKLVGWLVSKLVS